MKIRTREKSYEEVIALPGEKHRNPMRQASAIRLLLKAVSSFDLRAVDFSCEKIGMEKLGAKEPCLILMNHSSFLDLKIAVTLLSDREYHIVCTQDGFVGKRLLMRLLGCIPAKKFINDIVLIKDMRYAVQKLHASILMYPEASYSFDGTETPLPDSLGDAQIQYYCFPKHGENVVAKTRLATEELYKMKKGKVEQGERVTE